MNIQFRRATSEDENFLRTMLYHAIFVPEGSPKPPHDIVYEPSLAIYVKDFGTYAGDMGVIAVVDGVGVGASWIRLIKSYGYVDAQTPELSIAVLPDYRGQGIGSRLLRQLFSITDERYPCISLSVQSANPAYKLYLRLGFSIFEEADETVTMLRVATS